MEPSLGLSAAADMQPSAHLLQVTAEEMEFEGTLALANTAAPRSL